MSQVLKMDAIVVCKFLGFMVIIVINVENTFRPISAVDLLFTSLKH